jgi:hypothetical protein
MLLIMRDGMEEQGLYFGISVLGIRSLRIADTSRGNQRLRLVCGQRYVMQESGTGERYTNQNYTGILFLLLKA